MSVCIRRYRSTACGILITMTDGGRLAEPLVLVEPRGRRIRLFLLSLIVLAACVIVLVAQQPVVGWIGVAFFGPGALVFGANLVVPGRLELTSEGIRFAGIYGRWSPLFEWERCSEFRPWSPERGTTVITFRYNGDLPGLRGRLSGLSRRTTGGDTSMPSTYGLSGTALVHLLEEWQQHCVGEHPRSIE